MDNDTLSTYVEEQKDEHVGKIFEIAELISGVFSYTLEDSKTELTKWAYQNDLTDKNFEEIELPKKDKFLIGDSGSISVWPDDEYSIERLDGKTLYGFLKNPIIADFYYFGNIDVRFHLPRQANPIEATKDLVKKYINHAKINNAKVSC
jgi:hypothetical protein